MRKKFILILFLGIVSSLFGQNTIDGYAPDFIGQKVKLYTYQDYFTLTRVEIGEGLVSKEDSSFHISFQTNTTIKGIIEIERTETSLYLAPKTNYEVYIPASTELTSYANTETDLYFSSLDTTDINYRILQYHEWFDMYIAYNEKGIVQNGFLPYLDTFKIYAADSYKYIEDVFFITYVRYDIAEMEQTYGGNRKSEYRLQTFLNYIEPFPVYYENDRYMKFIRAFYDKEFREYLPKTEQAILKAINFSSPTMLMHVLKSDIFLSNPELRELVMLDKLGKAFYRELELRPNIIFMLDSVANHTESQVNANVARNVKNYITNLEPGYPAPAIQLFTDNNEVVNWGTYKGKFIYIGFFATWNERSMSEMEVIKKMLPTYEEDIVFLSVCTDKDKSTYDAFRKEHPEYDWDIFYIGEDKDLMNSFKVTSVPTYSLIDQEGFIYSSPALSPSPNGKYKSIDETLFHIKAALHPVKRTRVGE